MGVRHKGSRAPAVVVPMGAGFVVLGAYLLATSSGSERWFGLLAVVIGGACVVAGVMRYRRTGSVGEPR